MQDKGTIALVGSGEFLTGSDPLDKVLMAKLGVAARVVILPTASAPDGAGVPQRWAKMGVAHFERLGATAEPVMLLTREDAISETLAEQIARANFVYLSGGKPTYLVETLRDTACWRAIQTVFERGGVVAGCSAGAMALAGALPGVTQSASALGLAPGLVVIPHFDEVPGIMRRFGNITGHGTGTVVGVDGSTGMVGAGQNWLAVGKGGVTVFESDGRKRYTNGEQIILPALPA